jgi:hypothetical protein
VRKWGRPERWRATKGDPDFGIGRKQLFRFAGRGRAVTMGSIDKHVFRTALASPALIPVSQSGTLRIARAPRRLDPMTGRAGMILTFPGFGVGAIPAFLIGRSNVPLLRHMLRAVTA